jgi:hypothetical protein
MSTKLSPPETPDLKCRRKFLFSHLFLYPSSCCDCEDNREEPQLQPDAISRASRAKRFNTPLGPHQPNSARGGGGYSVYNVELEIILNVARIYHYSVFGY